MTSCNVSAKAGLHEQLIAQLVGRHDVARYRDERIAHLNALAMPVGNVWLGLCPLSWDLSQIV